MLMTSGKSKESSTIKKAAFTQHVSIICSWALITPEPCKLKKSFLHVVSLKKDVCGKLMNFYKHYFTRFKEVQSVFC